MGSAAGPLVGLFARAVVGAHRDWGGPEVRCVHMPICGRATRALGRAAVLLEACGRDETGSGRA